MRCDRRTFISKTGLSLSGLALGLPDFPIAGKGQDSAPGRIPGNLQTVRGLIKPGEMGLTLPHEHVMVDFIGADKVSKSRYEFNEVYNIMLPYLKALREQGITGFVECTPNYLARDPQLLFALSEATGLHILTNTGLYKEPYLPDYAFEESADQLAFRWIQEIITGIGETGIKAGFIKIAVHKEALKPMQQKIVRAACRTNKSTGATIACHTSHGPAALQILDIMEEEGVPSSAYIFVHAGDEKDTDYHLKVAERGAWIEYDDVGRKPFEHHVALVKMMIEAGYEKQILLSMDRGWYEVGKPEGGDIKPFTLFKEKFLPALRAGGISEGTIIQMIRHNPALAFQFDN